MRFSIIIPAYNSADYIRKALDSVKMQTFKDYELIVVCDSCEDDTEEIAKEYGAITYLVNFHQDGYTRNTGIDHAQGEILMFMDDDDWWSTPAALQLVDAAIEDADVLRFGFHWENFRGYCPPGDYYACWNKAYKRDFVGGVRFSSVQKWSDVDFFNGIYRKGPKLRDLNACLYHYNFMREGSQSWQTS